MSKNSQIILDQIINQEWENFQEYKNIQDFFEFYSALQILKKYELSYEDIESGITGGGNDGGVDSIYLFVNGDLIKEEEDYKEKYKRNVDIEFVLIQSKYSNSFSETPILKLSKVCKNLLNFDFKRSDYENRYAERVLSAFELFRDTYFALLTKKTCSKNQSGICIKRLRYS